MSSFVYREPAVMLSEDSEERKNSPITTGFLDYFPLAVAYVAQISKFGNDKHNPGEPLHHARGKSMDHADCIARHLIDRGGRDKDGILHSGYLAWRALALLEEELEQRLGKPLPRGARFAGVGEEGQTVEKGSSAVHTSDNRITYDWLAETANPTRPVPDSILLREATRAARPALAWNEGWQCTSCGTTELSRTHTEHDVLGTLRRDGGDTTLYCAYGHYRMERTPATIESFDKSLLNG